MTHNTEITLSEHLTELLFDQDTPPAMRDHAYALLEYVYALDGGISSEYDLAFVGRLRGSTDIREPTRRTLHAYNIEHAIARLHDTHENIGQIRIIS